MKKLLQVTGGTALFCLFLFMATEVDASHARFDAQAGRLLVASETIGDPRFAESVILLLRHDREGSIGLVLNNRSDLLPDGLPPEIVPKLRHIYFGGPVEPFAVSVLVFDKQPPEKSKRVIKDLHLTGFNEILELLEKDNKVRFRMFFGYASWAPGQLDMELAHGVWQLYPADARVLFQENVEQLWRQLMESGPVIGL